MVHHRNLIILAAVAFILIFSTASVQAGQPTKPGKPGLPECQARVAELEAQVATLQALLDGYNNYAPVAQTGETTCDGSDRNDGCLQKGVEWPVPRFTDNKNNDGQSDGTVTDNLTRLVWMKDMSCWESISQNGAFPMCNNLQAGDCGLTDGSVKGDWRLPNRNELMSMIDIEVEYDGPHIAGYTYFKNYCGGPPLPGFPCGDRYWSSSTCQYNYPANAYYVHFGDGTSGFDGKASAFYGVWCVRDLK